MPDPILELRNLTVEFATEDGVVHAVTEVSYDLHPGEILGIVGESGSGKSVSMLAVLGLIPMPPGRIASGEALYKGKNLLEMPKQRAAEATRWRDRDDLPGPDDVPEPRAHDRRPDLRGGRDPQPGDGGRRRHEACGRAARPGRGPVPRAARRAVPTRVLGRHATAGDDRDGDRRTTRALLVADEPTTALDVTIQAQIARGAQDCAAGDATRRPSSSRTISVVIAELADRVVVMYAGRVVELGDVYTIFNSPGHPYTIGLMNSLARLDTDQERLEPIPGQPPSMVNRPPGCAFHPRCAHSQGREVCRTDIPELRIFGEGGEHRSACHFSDELAARHVVGVGAEPS